MKCPSTRATILTDPLSISAECPYEEICNLGNDDDNRDDKKESNGNSESNSNSESNESDESDESPFGDDDYCEDEEGDDDDKLTGYSSDDDVGDFDRKRIEGTHFRKTETGQLAKMKCFAMVGHVMYIQRKKRRGRPVVMQD